MGKKQHGDENSSKKKKEKKKKKKKERFKSDRWREKKPTNLPRL